MVLIALFALVFARVAAERRRARIALVAELHRAEDRLRWAERMKRRGYVSGAQVAAERNNKDRVQSQLEELEGSAPERQALASPRGYGRPSPISSGVGP